MDKKEKLIAVVGPTATGKSDLGVLLAEELNGEIVSADSAQVYCGLDIGSAKVTEEEKRGIRHHLIDIVGPETEYNIGRFQKDAREVIADIHRRHKLPILCGGSGLYINSVINVGYELKDTPTGSPKQREQWLALEEREGKGALHRLLMEKFPHRAEKIHPNDYQRILRALEMTEDSDPMAEKQWESPYALSIYGLTMDRERLYQRIEERVDKMMAAGLEEEVIGLLARGYRKGGNALSALGYKEILPLLEGRISREEAVAQLKKGTRHFAKRQLTWFRRDPRIRWFDVFEDGGLESIARKIIALEKFPIA